MNRIVVPTDFSPNAEKALDYAVQIARQTKAEIFIMHSIELPDTPFNLPNSDSTSKIISNINDRLSMIRKSIYETELINVTTKLYTNNFISSVTEAIDEFKADFLIMGTIGNSGIQEKLFGSKTAVMIGKSPIPIMAIPLLSKWSIPSNILIAINDPVIKKRSS